MPAVNKRFVRRLVSDYTEPKDRSEKDSLYRQMGELFARHSRPAREWRFVGLPWKNARENMAAILSGVNAPGRPYSYLGYESTWKLVGRLQDFYRNRNAPVEIRQGCILRASAKDRDCSQFIDLDFMQAIMSNVPFYAHGVAEACAAFGDKVFVVGITTSWRVGKVEGIRSRFLPALQKELSRRQIEVVEILQDDCGQPGRSYVGGCGMFRLTMCCVRLNKELEMNKGFARVETGIYRTPGGRFAAQIWGQGKDGRKPKKKTFDLIEHARAWRASYGHRNPVNEAPRSVASVPTQEKKVVLLIRERLIGHIETLSPEDLFRLAARFDL